VLVKDALLEVTKDSNSEFATALRKNLATWEKEAQGLNRSVGLIVLITVAVVLAIAWVWAVVYATPLPSDLKDLTFERYVDEVVVNLQVRTSPLTE
jgi:hypothetical protein